MYWQLSGRVNRQFKIVGKSEEKIVLKNNMEQQGENIGLKNWFNKPGGKLGWNIL